MANHGDGAGQQDTPDSSTEWISSGDPPSAQEEGRLTSQGESEQGHQGMLPPQEAEHEQMSLQEHWMPQGEMSLPPQGALEPGAPTSDHQDDETPSSASEALPEQEMVPVPAERMDAEDVQLRTQQAE